MSALLDQCVECVMSLDCHIVNTLVPLIMEDVLRAQHVHSHKLCVLLINAVHPALPANVSYHMNVTLYNCIKGLHTPVHIKTSY